MSRSGKGPWALICALMCIVVLPIAYLLGDNATRGKSAYELWQELKGNESKPIEEFFESMKGETGDVGSRVHSIKKTKTEGLVDTYTITYTDGTKSTFAVTNGEKGEQGEQGIQGIQGVKGDDGHTPIITIEGGYWYIDGVNTNQLAQGVQGNTGNGISAVTLTKTEGLVDTYTITYTNGDTTTFTVTNGKKGEQGEQGIQGIQGVKGDDGHTPVITIEGGYWYIDGVNTTQSAAGLKGETGNGISAVTLTKTEGLVDTYTITYTNGDTTTFTVTNGAQGEQGIQGEKGEDGHTPVITINAEGYWTIDGVVTAIKAQGKDGANGKSAFELWLELDGNEGKTQEDFFNYLKGEDGTNGTNGENGKSAFELWLEIEGNENKSIDDFYAFLKGKDGNDGANGSNGNDGANGKSAYEIWLEAGNEGTPADFLASLKGELGAAGANGAEGKSAYDLWLEQGNEGSVQEFLESLKGSMGETGNGISSIEKTGTEGLVDTYTITYTNGDTTTFTVTNGAQGIQGIQGEKGADGHTPVITIQDGYWYVDGVNTNQVAQGVQGETGNGISAITLTKQQGLVDTYTITYTNGDTTDFTVTNGKDGLTWFTNDGAPTQLDGQKLGDYCLDVLTSDVYQFDGSVWSKVANIKGISVDNIQVEYLYDDEGRLFHRYTFTLTDGSVHVKDVYDPNQVYMIISEEYLIPKEELPTAIPEIYFTVIYSNSTRERVLLTKEMIVNIQEVHFSVVGEWEVMVNYYGCINFLYVTCYDPSQANVTSDSYLNYDTIVWTSSNIGSLGGLTLTAIYDNPAIDDELIYLATNKEIKVSAIYNGNRLAAVWETVYDSWWILQWNHRDEVKYYYEYRITEQGMLEYAILNSGDWKPISTGLISNDTRIYFTYKNATIVLKVNYGSDTELQNAKVEKFEYIGDTIYWRDEANPDVVADKTAVNFAKYGHLMFYIKTPTMEGPYLRNIDPTTDIFYRMDTGVDQTLIEFDPSASGSGALQCELHAPIQPGITNRRYVADNAVPILVSSVGITQASVALNKAAVLTTDSIKDLTVSFYIDQYPNLITVPLTEDMLVDGADVFKFDSVSSIDQFQREIRLQYQYYDTLLTGSTMITVIDASLYPNSSSGGVRYSGATAVEKRMKTTKDSSTVPEINVTITFKVKEDTSSLTYDSVNLHTISLTLTKDMITNLSALNFSREGDKVIEFLYQGVKRTVDITFYDVYKSPIESISYIDGEMEINYGDDLMTALINQYCPEGSEQTWTLTYKEEYDGKTEETVAVTPELVRACFDLSNFDSTITGMHSVPFRYQPIEGGAYETYISVVVAFDAAMGETYTVTNGAFGNRTVSEVSVDTKGQTIAWVENSNEQAAYYTVVEETDEYILANVRSINTNSDMFESVDKLTPALMPGTWREILESGDCLIVIDKQAKTVENYVTKDSEELYTLVDTFGVFEEGVNMYASFTDKQIIIYGQQAVEEGVENTNPLQLFIQLPVEFSEDGKVATPTLPNQTVPMLHGIFAPNGEKVMTLRLGAYGEEYAITNAADLGLAGSNPTVVLTEYGLYYRVDEMTMDDFSKMLKEMGYLPYHYSIRDGEKVLVIDVGGEDIYATIDEENRAMTVYFVAGKEITNDQIDWTEVVNRNQWTSTESTTYTYSAEGKMTLYTDYGIMDFTRWRTETYVSGDTTNTYTNTDTSFSNVRFEYTWFNENMLCVNLSNYCYVLDGVYFEYVKGEDGAADKYIARYANSYTRATYDVDFSDYSGIPEGYRVDAAQLVLSPDYTAELRLQGNIEGQAEASMSDMDLRILEAQKIIVCSMDEISFLFTYDTLAVDANGKGGTVKMVEVVEGEGWTTYGLDCSRFIQMIGEASVEVFEAKISLNRDLMMGTLYFQVNIPEQGYMMQGMAFSFLEFNGKILPQEELFGEMSVYFEKSETDVNVYVMNLDLSSAGLGEVETIYYHETYGQIIICANGYAWTEKPMDELTKVQLAPYIKLDDDLIFIHTVLGIGMVFKINDDNTLTIVNAMADSEEFESEEFMLGTMACAMYINKATGEGVLALNQNVEGSMILLPLYKEGENLYKSCILTVALIIERVDDGVFVMRSPQDGLNLG